MPTETAEFEQIIRGSPEEIQKRLKEIKELFEGNSEWRRQCNQQHLGFFAQHAEGQQPKYLFITCSDSRLAPSETTQSGIGKLFVTRNIANLVVPDDRSMLAVVIYAVKYLKVPHIIICGHHGCGGVNAAMELAEGRSKLDENDEPLTQWLQSIVNVYNQNRATLTQIENEEERAQELAKLNVQAQMMRMARLSVIRQAWENGDTPRIHGLIYDICNGELKTLDAFEFKDRDIAAIRADARAAKMITTQVERLNQQAQSYNPLKWIGAKAKAQAITKALKDNAMRGTFISSELNDPTSDLYRALNQHRLFPFTLQSNHSHGWFSSKARALQLASEHCEPEPQPTCQL